MAVGPPPGGDWGPPPQPGGLGARIVDGLLYVPGRVAEGSRQFINSILAPWHQLPEQAIAKLAAAAEEATWQGALRRILDPWPAVLVGPLIAGAVAGAVASLAQAVMDVVVKRSLTVLKFQIARAIPVFRMAAEDSIWAFQRGAWSREQAMSDLLDEGVSEDRAVALLARSFRWLTVGQIEELVYRRIIRPEHALLLLKGTGITDEQAELLLQTMVQPDGQGARLTPLSDLQTQAIRDVFNPAILPDLLEQLPSEDYFAEAARLGYSRERATRAWAAHWRLPSFTQAATFFQRLGPHRGVENPFTAADVDRVLYQDDMLAKYRREFARVLFRPPNRLDTWRLATSHLIDHDTAKSWLMDYGYSPELAETLATLGTAERRAKDRDLTTADVAGAYQRRLISHDAAAQMLHDLGYDDAETALKLARADYDRAQQRLARKKTTIRSRVLRGLLSPAEAGHQLLELGVPADEVADLLELWQDQLQEQIDRPAVGQLLGLYRDRVVSGPQLDEELRLAGLAPRYIGWLRQQADQQIAQELERLTDAAIRRQRLRHPNPTPADIREWVRRTIITPEQGLTRLLNQGYSASDAQAYISQAGRPAVIPPYKGEEGKVRVRILQEQLRRREITPAQLRAGLQALGMEPALADAIADYEELRLTPPPRAA